MKYEASTRLMPLRRTLSSTRNGYLDVIYLKVFGIVSSDYKLGGFKLCCHLRRSSIVSRYHIITIPTCSSNIWNRRFVIRVQHLNQATLDHDGSHSAKNCRSPGMATTAHAAPSPGSWRGPPALSASWHTENSETALICYSRESCPDDH
jgi:hypothetical protein